MVETKSIKTLAKMSKSRKICGNRLKLFDLIKNGWNRSKTILNQPIFDLIYSNRSIDFFDILIKNRSILIKKRWLMDNFNKKSKWDFNLIPILTSESKCSFKWGRISLLLESELSMIQIVAPNHQRLLHRQQFTLIWLC